MSDTLTLCAETLDQTATQAMAAALAGQLVDGDLILLSGDLGAGKTCFVQGLGQALDVTEQITSPTFTLISIYHGRVRLNHLDVYRLDDPHQILDLDLPELAEHGITVIEWGEKIGPALPPERLTIEFRYQQVDEPGSQVPDGGDGAGDRRDLELILAGGPWLDRAEGLRAVLEPWLVPC
ncbi:MAG: tRNA (adenosine(37)-N6)-threonylcarbamoyltransferase complex ATPase subunit type 1 TsaE [Actinomycetia bacterium]|nr:tRNA (adenosine(37)-N6)-threonylcarbamoyltransferase complex ATPase subunit type 1 TsaE [Actinomycetes bacterium]